MPAHSPARNSPAPLDILTYGRLMQRAQPYDAASALRRRGDPLHTAGAQPAPPAPPLLQPGSGSLEGRSLLDGMTLGTRVRPAAGARAAPAASTALAARKKQSKTDDDDDDGGGGGFFDEDDDYDEEDNKESKQAGTKTFKIKKHKLKKWLLPLLVGYKLKFMTLVPLLFATLALLVASAGFAGFFFAMFTAALTLGKSSGHHH
ncbi:putative dual specificity protein phosphatase [Frankliniella fusca]|uniref:Dual specificity protein phosphatase n=1 Tax=Frankliniella fusca TaxID=407009 RepID=A0AAE1LWU3_9NEOP|nr:putative dual specificity protein phosphatase [Frankliniella fusca]